MQHLSNTRCMTLYWIQPRFGKPEYELRSEKELFGTLRWLTHVGFDPALFATAYGEWKLKTEWSNGLGYMLSTKTVYITNLDGEVAVSKCERGFHLTRSAIVKFANGRRFRWRMNFGLSRCVFSGEGNEDLLVLKLVSIPQVKFKMQVDLVHSLEDLPEAPLLAALGLYVLFALGYLGGIGWLLLPT
jgi:hypothetical protein